MRIKSWDSISNSEEMIEDGTTASSDGTTYLDVVQYNNSYYRIKTRTLGSRATAPESPALSGVVDDTKWSMFAPSGDAAFNALIADSAFIANLTAKEVVITENNNPIAGLTSGIAQTGDVFTRGSVRIWAGNPIVNGTTNLTNCPFYVTNTGELHAGNIIATGGTIGGFVIGENYIGEVNGNENSWKGLKIYKDGRISVGNYDHGVDYALRVSGGVELLGNGKDILINAMADGGTVLLMGNIQMLLTNPSDSSTVGNVYTDDFSTVKLVQTGKTIRNQIEVKTSSFTLPNDPPIGTMFLVKRVLNDITITTGYAYVLNGSNNGTLWEPETTNVWSDNHAMILFYLGSINNIKYWTMLYSN